MWDPMVRIGHWTMAGFFAFAYYLGGDWLNMHAHAGYTVALLIAFRFFWGFFGPEHARFGGFVAGPKRLVDYFGRLARGRAPVYAGHDPAGGIMIVTILASLTVTTCSGMALFAMENRGPLQGSWVVNWPGATVEAVHHLAADLCVILAVGHVVGVLVMCFVVRQNLIASMFHGRKTGVHTDGE